jgi:hypothetical protein
MPGMPKLAVQILQVVDNNAISLGDDGQWE